MENCVFPTQAVLITLILQRSQTLGIWPVTMATTMLKPGGYERLEQIGQLF